MRQRSGTRTETAKQVVKDIRMKTRRPSPLLPEPQQAGADGRLLRPDRFHPPKTEGDQRRDPADASKVNIQRPKRRRTVSSRSLS